MNREDIICPGETIKELLEVYNYTQQDLADKLNLELKTVNEILNGKAPIMADTAIKLEMIFDVDAIFWNNLEFNYRKELKEYEEQEFLEYEYQEIKQVYKEMLKRNLVKETKNKREMVENFKKFMEITKIDNLQEEYYKVACRQANIKKFDMIYLMVWIQIGLKKAREEELKEYNKEKILSQIKEIRKLTFLDNQNEARKKLKEICNECGIIINYEKNMPNTAIYGISKWLNPTTPFIQVSDRGKNVATFWFSFMHELGHIIKGRKKMIFIDAEDKIIENEEDKQILRDVEEFKADEFSRNSLIPEKEYKNFINEHQEKKMSADDIILFAERIKIAPCIVAGRIKYDKNIYNDKILNSFDIKMEF